MSSAESTNAVAEFWSRLLAGMILVSVIVFAFGCSCASSDPTFGSAVVREIEPVQIREPFPIEVLGSKYEWHVRYPGVDGILHTSDDIMGMQDIRVPSGTAIDLQLKSADYVYLLALPRFEVKEVAVPTLEFHLTFQSGAAGESILDGDEFCGDPHPELKGRLIVEPVDQFTDWVREQAVIGAIQGKSLDVSHQ